MSLLWCPRQRGGGARPSRLPLGLSFAPTALHLNGPMRWRLAASSTARAAPCAIVEVGSAAGSCHLVMSQRARPFRQIRAPAFHGAFGTVQCGQARQGEVELYLDGRCSWSGVKQLRLTPCAAGRPAVSRVLSRALASRPKSFGTVVRLSPPCVGSPACEGSSPACRVV